MPVNAVRHIRKMHGGAQSHLMYCDDGFAYVVKFQNNPQGKRILANEILATTLASAIGLTVPPCEVVNVGEWLISVTPDLTIESEVLGNVPCKPGRQFGSRVAGIPTPGGILEYLDDETLIRVKNLNEFAGILAFDKRTGNRDNRQVVYSRSLNGKRFTAHFIDHGYCFNAQSWTFSDIPRQGTHVRLLVYHDINGWRSFQPWLERIESFDPKILRAFAGEIPPEWYGNDSSDMQELVRLLILRRETLRKRILDVAALGAFRNWDRPLTVSFEHLPC